MNEVFSKLEDEAYARVIWGDDPRAIVEWLVQKGMPAQDAEALIREFKAERAADIRKSGLARIFYGIGAIGLVAIIGIGITFVYMTRDSGVIIMPRIVPIAAALAVGWGLWMILTGVSRLLSGKFRGGLSELD